MKDLWETLRVKEPHMSNPVSAAERLARGRRKFLQLGAALSGLLVGCRPSSSVPQPGPSFLGGPVSEYGLRSQFEKTVRLFRNSLSQENNGSQTPLQDLEGIINAQRSSGANEIAVTPLSYLFKKECEAYNRLVESVEANKIG